MLGLVLLYFIGKKFFELADEYEKNKWGFAILDVATYYGGAFLAAIIWGIIEALVDIIFLETANDLVLGLIFAPFGLLACYFLYLFLEKKWKAEKPATDIMIDKIGND